MAKSIQELREQRGTLAAAYRQILDSHKGNTIEGKTKQNLDGLMAQIDDVDAMIREHDDALDAVAARMSGQAAGSDPAFTVTANGKRLPALKNTENLASYFPTNAEENFSLGDFVRSNMGVGPRSETVITGPAIVPTSVGAGLIDMVRAASRVVQAGAVTIPLDGPTNMAKLTGDLTVYQHTEGADDITESKPTIVPVSLNPKALVALVPLSMEVVADSPNLDMILRTSISAAFAGKLDTVSLATILADANIPTSTVGEDPGTWAGILAGASSMLNLNMELPSANICAATDFMARGASMADSAGSWLGCPPILENMADLYTTKVDAGTAILGDFAQGFGIASRQDIRLEVVRFQKPTSASHLLVCHCRMEGFVLQPNRLYVQKKTVA